MGEGEPNENVPDTNLHHEGDVEKKTAEIKSDEKWAQLLGNHLAETLGVETSIYKDSASFEFASDKEYSEIVNIVKDYFMSTGFTISEVKETPGMLTVRNGDLALSLTITKPRANMVRLSIKELMGRHVLGDDLGPYHGAIVR